MGQRLWKIPWHYLLKMNMCNSLWPSNSTPMHPYVPQKTCCRMFIAALLIIAHNWKLTKCPRTIEWTNSGTFTQWNTVQQWEWTHCNYMQQCRRTSQLNVEWKKSDQKKNVCNILFYLYKCQKQAKWIYDFRSQESGAPGRLLGVLVIFCFLIRMLVTLLCAVCEN